MTMLKSIIAASAGLVGGAHAFWRMECPGRVTLARLDPIVSPGEVSAHVHTVHGSGAFGMIADTASLMGSDCTSCRVTQDKSAYWTPALYFKDATTGEFEIVEQIGGMLAYYLLNGQDIQPFPTDFRMIAGENNRRNYTLGDPHEPDPEKSNWAALGQDTQTDLMQRAIGFNCLDYAKDPEGTLYRHFMPDKDFLDANCKDGLRLELMFPSCWDGKNTQSDDSSHVAYPHLVIDGDCPDSHPVRLPGLLYETIWGTDAFEGRDGIFVIANGDPTGFGYHGDFIMGWEEDFLKQAVDECTNLSGRIEDCPIFNVVDEAEAKTCEAKLPSQLSAEKLVEGLSELPGDVQITYEDGQTDPEPINSPSASATETYKPGVKPTSSGAPLPGNVFKESMTSGYSPTAAKPTTSSSSSYVPPAVVAAAEVPTTTASSSSSVSASSVSAEPTTAPSSSAAPAESSYYSTQYITNGNVVTKILWDDEVVWITEVIDTTTTVTRSGGPAPSGDPSSAPAAAPAVPTDAAQSLRRRRMAHLHGHNHHRS